MTRYFLVFLFLTLSISSKCQDDIVHINADLPFFSVKDEGGNSINTNDLKGKVVLINFFATWCGPCLSELPLVQKKIWNKYKDNKNFCLLVIGREHSNSEIRAFKEKNKYLFPMFPDETKDIYLRFATKYIPRNYLINKQGKIVYLSTGFSEPEFEKLLGKLDELLNE